MYKFVTIAKMTMKRMRINDNGFKILTKTFAVFGIKRCIMRPIARGINRPAAIDEIRV